MTVRVLVVDDDPLVRAALTMVLGGAEGLELVGQAADGEEAVALTRKPCSSAPALSSPPRPARRSVMTAMP